MSCVSGLSGLETILQTIWFGYGTQVIQHYYRYHYVNFYMVRYYQASLRFLLLFGIINNQITLNSQVQLKLISFP